MHRDNCKFTGGVLYADGVEIGPCIPTFEYTEDDVQDMVRKTGKWELDPEGSFTFTVKMHIDSIWVGKLTGMYQWIDEWCPNRRLIHLMKYGKNKRVKNKNYRRALVCTAIHVVKEAARKIEEEEVEK